MNKILSLIFVLSICSIASAQTGSRITAFANFGADTTIPCTDSGGYNAYSYERGGQINASIIYWDCDFPFIFRESYDFETGHCGLVKFDSSWETGPGDTDMSTQSFDIYGNIATAAKYIYSGGTWHRIYQCNYTYDMHNNPLQEIDSNVFSGGSTWVRTFVYTYDAANRTTSATYYYAPPLVAVQAIFTYDPAGNMSMVQGYEWDTTISSWKYIYKRLFSFNALGQPLSFLDTYFTPTVIVDSARYYFSPTNDTMIRSSTAIVSTNTYDAAHNKTSTTTIGVPGSAISTIRTLWTYNTFNQVTSERFFLPDSTGNWIFQDLKRYYYEPYPDAVPTVALNTASFQVFPSPAQNQVTVKLSWPQTQVNTTISILNAAGQIVRQLHEPQVQHLEKNIDITTLPAGNYFVVAVAGIQKLVQQLVVAH